MYKFKRCCMQNKILNINDFKNYVAAEFRKAMEGVEDADLMDRADAVADRLSNTKTIKPCLKKDNQNNETQNTGCLYWCTPKKVKLKQD